MQKYHDSIHRCLNDSSVFLANARQHWSTQGFNEPLHIFEDSLALNGEKNDQLKTFRLRTQMRQIYVFAQGYAQTGNETYFEVALESFKAAEKLFKNVDGLMCHAINAEGEITNFNVHVFEQAFVIFAAAWLYHVTDNQHYLNEAENAWHFIEKNLKNSSTDTSLQQQNSYMHLFEAHLFAYLLTGNMLFYDRLQTLYPLLMSSLFDDKNGVIREHFNSDFSNNEKSNIIEIGHAGEWIYLLHLYSKMTGESTEKKVEQLYESLLKSLDKNGFVCDESLLDLTIVNPNKRLWAQCETLKAHLVMFEKQPNEINLERVLNLTESLFKYYLLPDQGLWHEHLNAQNVNIYPSIPATTLYHLNLTFSELQRVLYPLVLPKCHCQTGEHA